ncbi:MAG: hypothetical protein ABL995_12550 [Bryobacteraceae bacterium]
MKARLLSFLVAICLAAPTLLAETAPTAGKPKSWDWTGYYVLARTRALQGTGLKPVNEDLDKTIIEHLKPWAKLKMEATSGDADDTGAVCKADGIFRNPPFAGRFLWLPSTDMIAMVFHEINTAGVHRIYTNRPHPKNPPPTWNGDAVGHWEGDTLVVDTIGFSDKSWLMSAMEPHTEETRMTERIRQVLDGKYIEIVTVVEDRHALTSAYTYTRYYKKQDSIEWPENICAEDLGNWREWRKKALDKQYRESKLVK